MTPEDCIHEFERHSSLKDWPAVAELITPDAAFFFNEGTFRGHEAIRKAFEDTWAYNPEGESYTLHGIRWLAQDEHSAACTYGFTWQGILKGRPLKSVGRGTAVLVKAGDNWKIAHEHLSADPGAER